MRVILWVVLLLLAGCDQLQQRIGIPDPAQVLAEGKAIGGACRNAGRGLEDCFHLNPDASKAAIFAGWKEMNEYMTKNNMPVQIPRLSANSGSADSSTSKARKKDDEESDTKSDAKPDDTKRPTDGKTDPSDGDAGK